MRALAMGMTSTGSGKAPSASTFFEASAMHTNWRDCAATIFSRVRAAPPPLIMWPWPSISSAPSTYTASSSTSLASNTGMPRASRRSVDATELDTAPLIWSFIVASASMNLLTVEPVPTPMISPGTTYCSAAWPTRVLSSSWVI